MKRKVIAIIGTLMLVAALVPMTVGATPEMATRDLPDSVLVNEEFDVTITVTTGWGSVVETLPANFTYVSCAAGTNMAGVSAAVVGQVVTFTFFASTTPATFIYTVTAPSTAVTGAAFSGVIKYGSPVTEEAVGGDATMDVTGVGVGVATRDLPVSVAVNAGFDVTITVTTGWGSVVETLPANFTYVSCAAGTNMAGVSAMVAGQVVTFTFFATATPATFTYTVTAPSSPVTGAAFSGVIKYGSPVTEEAVGGDATMDVGVGVYYTLTIAVSPAGSGTTTPAVGTHSYAADTDVTITATAASGYTFSYWTGDVACASCASTTVTMDADKSVTAYFVVPAEYLTFADWINAIFV